MTKLENAFGQLMDDIKNLHDLDSFYYYEKEFTELYQQFGQKLLEHSLSDYTSDRRKKKRFKRDLVILR